ncbi:helix-turn-helix transcriptional regulator [Actinomadura sp. DC4]|uniref:helix-turn-helix domain-containing protein n=1 Tax=Actinomadura sp. DC4 TaxID=3055069 RepID=UPI0025B1EFBB|nr:helix-turn-helix transcriptional regulator [Actinomadura sp. DC4]MDN3354654.1 helix-turn-helix transcriptional regulator [Actinomadura sp. DC4]
MSTRVGLSISQRRAASELKRLRELALLTADQVAQRLGWSASKISRLENARIRLRAEDVRRLLDLYGVAGDQRQMLLSLLQEDEHKRWWEAYTDILSPDLLNLISFEAEASTALNYEPMVVPGLLQTEAYARRVIRMWQSIMSVPPPELDRRLEVRLTRQKVILSDDPLELSVVIDEAVLRRQIDDRSVMREQLHHLVNVSELPNIKLQILPLSGRHVISAGPLMSLSIPEFGDVVYLENFMDGRLYVDDNTLIYQHARVFEQLKVASLTTNESRELIRRTAEELWVSKVD